MAQVFLSYSHQDNEVPENWVDKFYDELNKYTKVYSGIRSLKIWKDTLTSDPENDRIEDKVKKGLSESDIFIALVSPSYLQGFWGNYEREYFTRFAGDNAANHNRILNVIKLVLEPDEEKKIIENLNTNFTYSFCRFDEGQPVTLEPNHPEFKKTMVAIATSITTKLRQKATAKPKKIFLARTTEDLLFYQVKLKSELETLRNSDVQIYSAGNLGENSENEQREISEIIDQCDLAIHMFGIGRGHEQSKQQWETVINRARTLEKPIKILSWIPTNVHRSLRSADHEFQGFINNSVTSLDFANHDYIINSFEDFLISAKEKLKSNV